MGRDLSERSFVQVHSGTLRRRLTDNHNEHGSVDEREVTLFDNQMAICFTVSISLFIFFQLRSLTVRLF